MAYTLGDIGNVPGQAFDFLKRQAGRFVNLTKPGADDDDYTTRSAAIARQRKLADMLSQMGEQEQAVSTAGGITAPMSGMGALARGLTSFGGAYLSGKASADEAAVTKAKEGEDAETLRQIGEALAGTPEETVALAPTDPTLGQRNLQDIMSMSGSRQPTPDELAAALGGNAPPGRAVMKNMVPGDVSKAAQIALKNPRFANQGLALQVGETQRRIKQAEDETKRARPNIVAAGANGMIDNNPDSPTFGQMVAVPAVKPLNKTPFAAVVNGKPGMFVYNDAGQLEAVPGMTPFRTGGGDNGGPFGGTSMTAQFMNTLIKGNTGSPEYALAYNAISKPHTEFDQATMRPVTIPGMNMEQFQKPSGPVAPGSTGQTPFVGPAIGETKDIREARAALNVFDAQAAELEKALKGFSVSDKALYATTGIANGGAAKAIGAYNAMVTIIRDPQLINTGVLQQGELTWLNSFLFNPGTIKGMLSGDKATINSFGELRGIIANRLKAKQEVYGMGPTTPGGVSPFSAMTDEELLKQMGIQ